MLSTAPSDWMARFQQVASNLQAFQQPARSSRDIKPLIRIVSVIAAGFFAICGYKYNRGAYLLALGCAAFAYAVPASRRRVSRAAAVSLEGIVEGLKELTRYKRELCVDAFDNVSLNGVDNAADVIRQALTQWSREYNKEDTGTDAITKLQIRLTDFAPVEVQYYRHILPAAGYFIAQRVPEQLSAIQNAAFEFVHGHENDGNPPRGYINLTIKSGLIEARAWQPISLIE